MASGGGAPFPNLSDALNRLGHQLHADLTDDVYRRDAARHFENHLQCTLNQARRTDKVPLFPGPSRLVPQCGGCAINTVKKPIRHVSRHQKGEFRRIGSELGPTESDTTEFDAHQNPQMVQKVTSKLCLIQKQESNYGKNAARTEVGQNYVVSEDFPKQPTSQRHHRDRLTSKYAEKQPSDNESRQNQRPRNFVKQHETREVGRTRSHVAVAFSQTDINKHDQNQYQRDHSHLTPKRRPEKVELMALRAEECNYGRVEKKYSAKWNQNGGNENYRVQYNPVDANNDDTLNIEATSIIEKPEKSKSRHRHCLPSRVEDAVATAPSGHLLYAPVELQAASEAAVKSIDRSVGALERLALLAPKDSIDKGQLKTIQLMCVFLRQFHTELRSKHDRATKLEIVLRMWNVLQAQSASHGQGRTIMPPDEAQKPIAPMSLSNADNTNSKRYNRPIPKSTGDEPTIKPTNMSPSSVQVDFTAKKEKPQRSR
uniref:C2H2-type domain-containing protein n=1 Tax=Panagrellus redivivus TaxID=6233 RepID=A0A7E4UVX9_PANRE